MIIDQLMPKFIRAILLVTLLMPIAHQAFGSVVSPGDVIKGHAKDEENCDKCHKKFNKSAQSGLCKECHKEVGKDIGEKRGFHGRIQEQKDCRECHTEHKGRDAKIVIFDSIKFDHKQTDFELKGGHLKEKVKCKDCHAEAKKYSEAPSACNSCHKKDDKHKGNLGPDCAKCHSEKDWKTTFFDHSKTHFELLGKHKEVKCEKCHLNDKFKDTPKTCVGCHKKDDDKAHKGKLGPKCETCHNEKDWKTTKFDHDKTKFPLLGKHDQVKCDDCHIGKKYKGTPTLCYSCHKKDDDKVHKGKFGSKCETCHVERNWKEIVFDHDLKTKYPLLGKHKTAKCVSCHKPERDLYKEKLEMICVSCHKKEDDKAHKGNFGTKCESCHVERDWKEVLFDHDKKTKFPLLGKHRPPLKCSSCHKGDLYKDKLEMTCISCHEKDDKHKGQEGKKCETCHNAQDWKTTTFKHNTMSKFLLLGNHALVECKKCHPASTFKDAKSDCFSCHEKDDAIVHKRRLGTECQECHNVRSWKSWDFDHNKTSFKLDGPHKNISDCYKCHIRPMAIKVKTDKTCASCHDKDDVHNGDFGSQCDRCHDGNKWRDLRSGMGNKN